MEAIRQRRATSIDVAGFHKFVAARAPADAHCLGDLGGEAGIYFGARVSPADIGRRLLALGEKPGTQVGPFRAEITYPDLSAMPWSEAAARDQIADTILKTGDPVAIGKLAEVLDFNINLTASYWHRLRQIEPLAAQFLMEGRLKDAFSLLPSHRWGAIGSAVGLASSKVGGELLRPFIMLWVANDLQMAAEAARVKIYTPTGISALDGPDPTIAPLIDGVTKRIRDEIELFDRAMELLAKLAPGEKANKNQTRSFRGHGLDKQARSFLAQWLCEIRRDRSMSRAQLEQVIFARLSRGRREVEQIAKAIKRMREKKPGKKVTVNQGKWLYSLQTPQPLERLYMSCRYAASWCKRYGPSDEKRTRAHDVVALLCGGWARDSGRARRPNQPPMIELESECARTLFFIMRNAVVEDPTHLPKEVGRIVDPGTGEKRTVRSNHEVRRVTGTKIPFKDIWSAFDKPSPYDSGQTNVADAVRALLGPKPYRETMINALRTSQGTIMQRLV